MSEPLPPPTEPAILLPTLSPGIPLTEVSSPPPIVPLSASFSPPPPTVDAEPTPLVPSSKQQSWGALISIVVIVCMIVVGAFYAWGKRIAEVTQYQDQGIASTTTAQ